MEPTPLPVKGCSIYGYIDIYWLLAPRNCQFAGRPLSKSREFSSSRHTDYNTGRSFLSLCSEYPQIHNCCRAFQQGIVNTCLKDVSLLQPGIVHSTLCMQN